MMIAPESGSYARRQGGRMRFGPKTVPVSRRSPDLRSLRPKPVPLQQVLLDLGADRIADRPDLLRRLPRGIGDVPLGRGNTLERHRIDPLSPADPGQRRAR